MKKRITAFTIIILLLISNAGSLFASGHSDCKMIKPQVENHCEMMDLKKDCCPEQQKIAGNNCECPEMNSNNQDKHKTKLFILVNSLEKTGKIVLPFSLYHNFQNETSRNPTRLFSKTLKPDNKIYKTIHSFLI